MRLTVSGVCFNYGSIGALENVSLQAAEGEIISLLGPNGSGKSTLLKCINKILMPKKGAILISERNTGKVGLKELARMLGYVPQSGASFLSSTVFDAVLLGRRPHMNWNVSSSDREIVSRILTVTGLENMALRYFSELSGGEKQKVLIARALAQEPEVLLLDEPTSNLDLRHQFEVMNLVSNIVKDKRISVIMAIHDLNLASRYSDKLVLLKKGMVFAAGEPGNVLTQENIQAVYGVDAIVNNDAGKPYILPLDVS